VAFSEGTDLIDSTEAEIKRIRLYTEHVLYSARLCEAFIKQMLFCTAFPESHYRGSALGSLLSRDCVECAHSSNTNGHRLSLLGSLAHRYGLCRYYEGCLVDHMTIVNRRRDVEAAHSGITEFNPSTPAEARKELKEQTNKVLTELAHMLEHLGHIEQRMVAELNQMIRQATDICPVRTHIKRVCL